MSNQEKQVELTRREKVMVLSIMAGVIYGGLGIPTLFITWITNGHSCEILPMVMAGWCVIFIVFSLVRIGYQKYKKHQTGD